MFNKLRAVLESLFAAMHAAPPVPLTFSEDPFGCHPSSGSSADFLLQSLVTMLARFSRERPQQLHTLLYYCINSVILHHAPELSSPSFEKVVT